jgi:uncharacterized protein (DUF885 family)
VKGKFMLHTSKILVLFAILLFCTSFGVSWAYAESPELAAIQDEYWEFKLRESPMFATSTGDSRYNDQLGKVSVADSERRNKAFQEFLTRLEAVDHEPLSEAEQINRSILQRHLRDTIAEFRFGDYLMPVTQRSGFYLEFPELRRDSPLNNLKDYENYIARLNAFGDFTDGHIELMRAGVEAGKVLPAVVLEGWEPGADAQIVEDPTKSLLYEPFENFPDSIDETQQEVLRTAGQKAIAESVVPAYKRFRKFMADEYVPRARDTISASALPDGRDYYRHRVKSFTTTDMTPEEVHQLGLAEVKRIRVEMDKIIAELKFDGDFAAFVEHLRTDPKFYAKTPDELLKEVALILKRMDGQLPLLFGKLPRIPYGVREVPAYVAPRTTAAYYQPPIGGGTKAGFYFVNTYNLKSRPYYNLEALSFHEAVPGHHLQLALQQELTDMPPFRRYSDFTVFVEGWALYAERLGLEAGFYQDPYSNFGRLTMEMWRACRLVVDTGMHYLGWSREQAIQFLYENSALSMHDIQAEVDRYISWPGQALAYKVGELKIRELRKMAEEQLKDSFDVREFHDVVLSSGAVPLDVLEAKVKAWLATKN